MKLLIVLSLVVLSFRHVYSNKEAFKNFFKNARECFGLCPREKEQQSEEQFNHQYGAGQKVVDEFKEAHGLFDYNGDKKVTVLEIIAMLDKVTDLNGKKVFDISKETAEAMMNDGDLDKNGELTEEEWIKMFIAQELKKYIKEFGEDFQIFDKNQDKTVTEEELTEIFTKMGIKDSSALAQSIVGTLDSDGDKKLTSGEFIGILTTSKANRDRAEKNED